MKVLQISPHFTPNLGGVETHLEDLVKALKSNGYQIFMLSYRPLMTKMGWRIFENHENLKVLRIPWIPGLFYKLANSPVLAFLYLAPGLFVVTPFILLSQRPEVVHAHGLIAGFVGTFWGRVFGKRVIISTHSMYHFPSSGVYSKIVKTTFSIADTILTLSEQSRQEVIDLEIKKDKVVKFTYWIDLEKFKDQKSKIKVTKDLRIKNSSFIVLFVGRLVEEKGVSEALKAAEMWDENIHLVIAGDGPLKNQISKIKSQNSNIHYLGRVEQEKLPRYYSAADIVLVPSTHEEGFGRVILESLACGTPVVAANRGAIPEAMDESVGRLIIISPKNIQKVIEGLHKNKAELKRLKVNTREFAEQKYSIKNVETIISSYKQ